MSCSLSVRRVAVAIATLFLPQSVSAQFTQIDETYFGTPAVVGVDSFEVTDPAVIGYDFFPDGSPIPTPNPITSTASVSEPLTTAFEPVGVLLGSDDVAISQPASPGGIGVMSSPNALAPEPVTNSSAPFDVTFLLGARAAGVWTGDGPTNDTRATFRDTNGNEITTLMATPSPSIQFLGIQSVRPIGSIQLTTTGSDDYFLEDLHFEGFSFCPLTPVRSCLGASKAVLAINEAKVGAEKFKVKMSGFSGETTQSTLGDPVSGSTRYDVCIYDPADDLVGAISVNAAGQTCGPKSKPCWKATGTKGWLYKDTAAAANGVKVLKVGAGSEGKGKAIVVALNKAAKGQTALPLGIPTALAGTTSARLRVLADDGECFDANLTAIATADATKFRGKAVSE